MIAKKDDFSKGYDSDLLPKTTLSDIKEGVKNE